MKQATATKPSKFVSNRSPKKRKLTSQQATFQDNRPSLVTQKKMLQMIGESEYTTMQRKEVKRFISPQTNKTGLPDPLKTGIENLSGYTMDDVKVHYNSSKPTQVQAHAYAQGNHIYLGAGQEHHLPHEAWHVVQQKQGRVKPTTQLEGKVHVNDDVQLEQEADMMGTKALQLKTASMRQEQSNQALKPMHLGGQAIVQRSFDQTGAWMQEVSDDTLLEKFGPTTTALWSALRKSQQFLSVYATGSGANYNFGTGAITLSKDWHDAIKNYVQNGTQNKELLGKAIAALTHELSHAHDHLVKKSSPRNKSKQTDAYVTAVLETELKAWMKEARSARENFKGKGIHTGDENSRLIMGWLGIYFSEKEGKDFTKASHTDNPVVGRLNVYFNKNKSAHTSTTLQALLADSSNGLRASIIAYAQQIRGQFVSDDQKLRAYALTTMGS